MNIVCFHQREFANCYEDAVGFTESELRGQLLLDNTNALVRSIRSQPLISIIGSRTRSCLLSNTLQVFG